MNSKFKRVISATALFVAFAISQTYLAVGFAGSVAAGPNAVARPQQPSAILTTAGNKPISVNGAAAISGATILSGATVETPDQVGANIDIPGQSRLEISAKAKLVLTFATDSIKVTLIRGCVELHTRKGTTGEIVTESGKSLGKTDPARDGDLKVCEPRAGGGVGAPVVLGIVGAGAAVAAIVALAGGGDDGGVRNPSPSAP